MTNFFLGLLVGAGVSAAIFVALLAYSFWQWRQGG